MRTNPFATAGTVINQKERDFVVEAVERLGNPRKFNRDIKWFEQEFAAFTGTKYCIATVNGTAALHLSLLALGIGKGDEVILPDMTYVACANVISYTGATPVFCDIKPDTWCIDPADAKRKVTSRTKAIMPVWMYGNAPDMDALRETGIPLIEDACPAAGSYYKGQHSGSFGATGCFSFQGAKILAAGEGGALVTNDEEICKEARLYADMYATKEFYHERIGYMYEMNNITAAVCSAQLVNRNVLFKARKKTREWYYNRLWPLVEEKIIGVQLEEEQSESNCWMTSILARTPEERIKLRAYLKTRMIDTRPVFPPISSFPMYESADNPVSYDIGFRGINLPCPAYIRREDIYYDIVPHIVSYYEKHSA